jgi:hypothetical protein
MTRLGVIAWLVLLSISQFSGPSVAAEDHGFQHHHVAVSVGGRTPLEATSETSRAVGADYEYRFDARWGAGVIADAAIGSHKRSALISGGVTFRPSPRLRLGTGPGLELVEKGKSGGGTKNEAHLIWGVSGYYEFHVGDFAVGPVLFVDFVGETKTNLTYALSIGRGW